MTSIILATFPGLLFSVEPPARTPHEKTTPAAMIREHKVQPTDSCSTYILMPDNTLYYQGKPISPELLHKLGPLAAPLKYGLSQDNVG